MHNSYFYIVMVIMCDECLLSQQGSWLVCVCECERLRKGVRSDGNCPLRQQEKSVSKIMTTLIILTQSSSFLIHAYFCTAE